MTNININPDTLRQALNGDEEALKEVRTLLSTPRTLADMTTEERAECEWMQCDHPALEEPGVILQVWGNGCRVLSREGVVEAEALNHVAPRPDLPRMEWPGNEPEDDVAAATGGELTTQDVVDECRAVRKERATPEPAAPRPEDVPVGEPWLLEVDGRKAIGFRNYPEDRFCWTVVYRDIESTDQLRDDEVTLVARLVSETTEQDDEPVFDPAYTYRDKDGDKWGYVDGGWRWKTFIYSTPPRRYGPYTRIEKEVIIDSRDLLKSRQYLDSDGCVWKYRVHQEEEMPGWHYRLEGSRDWDPLRFRAPVDGPWTEYGGQD